MCYHSVHNGRPRDPLVSENCRLSQSKTTHPTKPSPPRNPAPDRCCPASCSATSLHHKPRYAAQLAHPAYRVACVYGISWSEERKQSALCCGKTAITLKGNSAVGPCLLWFASSLYTGSNNRIIVFSTRKCVDAQGNRLNTMPWHTPPALCFSRLLEAR